MSFSRRLPHWRPVARAGSLRETEGGRFAAEDRLLDLADSGPLWLNRQDVATCIVETLRLGDYVLGSVRRIR